LAISMKPSSVELPPPRARISSPRRTVKSDSGLRRHEGVGLMKETGKKNSAPPLHGHSDDFITAQAGCPAAVKYGDGCPQVR
jgi:hypothetical protein